MTGTPRENFEISPDFTPEKMKKWYKFLVLEFNFDFFFSKKLPRIVLIEIRPLRVSIRSDCDRKGPKYGVGFLAN